MDSSEEELLLVLVMRRRRRRRMKTKRSLHTHPLLRDRLEKGLYYTLYDDLRQSGKKFFQYFRMSKTSFDELLENGKEAITGKDTILRKDCPCNKQKPPYWYLGAGSSMMGLHFQYRIGVSTISYIIRHVCSAIWRKMKSICFPDLSKDLWLASAEGFHKKANFPHCVGAVDGKHIRIVKPTSSGSLYYNYKNYFSILLLAVCDSTYKFLFIDVGAYGKSSDSTVFRNTVLNNKLQDGTLDLPAPKQLSLSFERPMPFMTCHLAWSVEEILRTVSEKISQTTSSALKAKCHGSCKKSKC
ncbi:uncharacterized protein LOC124556195 [Schistocerca americana]|uniref:uncharacterized protein LOC124556195 n=1 Tax=Schistocerca americana TaxID=7009 RepID=UPI001F4FD9ED|nr:uncharacterized protein LOC124556195 [Schistocerca americana]